MVIQVQSKAVTSNIAENYAIRQLQIKRNNVEDVYKEITLKHIGKGTIGKLTKEINSKLKLSLEETTGKTQCKWVLKLLGKEDLVGDLAISLDDKIIANIASAGAEVANKVDLLEQVLQKAVKKI